jgi:hypothetical protein
MSDEQATQAGGEEGAVDPFAAQVPADEFATASPADEFTTASPVNEYAPDTPETHAPADFPPPPLEMQPPAAGEPWESLPAGMPLDAGGPAPPKKRTGLVVAIVIGVLVLICGCGGAIVAALIDFGSPTTSSTEGAIQTGAEEERRQELWLQAKASFPTTGYVTYAADERQAKLAGQAVAMLLPDFEMDELRIHPGTYDAAENWYEFDTYVTRLRLKSDLAITLLFACDVATAEAEAAKLSREDIELDADDRLESLPGGAWLIYVADSKEPLFGGIKDPAYVELLRTAEMDWSGGDVSIVSPMSDGGVDVHVFTLSSYVDSEAHDFVECVYRLRDGAWTLVSYDIRTSSDTQEPLVVPSET